jgi:hypothetical protein
MSGEDSFLRRWSRLKRQAPAQPPAPAPIGEALPDEEPPPAETIPLDEIALWLNRRVPQAWRILALRRLWVSDATIASYIGPADYQWDWETIGGSPGWGPLRAVDDIADLLSRAIGEYQPPPPQIPEDPVVNMPEQDFIEADLEVESTPGVETLAERPPAPQRRRGGAATPV